MKVTVTRFSPSERWLHNVVMVTFIALLMTGMGMLAYNLKGDQGASRQFIVSIHKYISLVFLFAPVFLALKGDRRIWKENIRILTTWGKSDIEWLMKKPLTSFFRDMELPLDDKFNPGQKTWATIAVSGSLVLALTGVIMWVTGSPILALIVHTLVAVGLAFALSGHIFMAVANKDTRPGLTSIIDGDVDAHWAAHHHPLWMERETRRRILEKTGASSTHHHEKPVGDETKKVSIHSLAKPGAVKTTAEAAEPVESKSVAEAQPAAEAKVKGKDAGFSVASVIKIPKNMN